MKPKQTNGKEGNSVDDAERVLAELEARRVALVERGAELAETRKRVAYAAHVITDPEARRELDRVNAEVATHDSEMGILLSGTKLQLSC